MSSAASLIKVYAAAGVVQPQRTRRSRYSPRKRRNRRKMARWLICPAVSLLYAQAASAQPAAPPPAPVLFDRAMTPGAGATVTNSVARLLARGEDRIVPLRLFSDE